jgi:hypothetical protein
MMIKKRDKAKRCRSHRSDIFSFETTKTAKLESENGP